MKQVIARAVFTALLLGIGSVYLGPAPADAGEKVTLCHFPPGNPENFHTLSVGAKAADAHIRNHGDVLGECCSVDSICDDGDACTANFCADNACTSEPVDCDDENPCTDDSCDPDNGCISEPVVCDDGQACNSDTGACLPVGACPCWLGSNPIERLTAIFANVNPFSCVEPMNLTCDGTSIRLSGEGSGPNGASASVSLQIGRPGVFFCSNGASGGGFGTCSCPPPPEDCFGIGFVVIDTAMMFLEPTTCVEEFDAACAAVQ